MEPKLPDLHQAVLPPETVEQLFCDIEACTRLLEVIPKFSGRGHVAPASVTLDEGKRLLLSGQARALQVRYDYDGSEWWDTLMNTPAGVRVVRIQHDFTTENLG